LEHGGLSRKKLILVGRRPFRTVLCEPLRIRLGVFVWDP
jgi:hypothetical protein